jgi:hypothetical protein
MQLLPMAMALSTGTGKIVSARLRLSTSLRILKSGKATATASQPSYLFNTVDII